MSLWDSYDQYQHNRDVRSATRNNCGICNLPVRGGLMTKICPGHSTSNRTRADRIYSYQSPRIKYGFGQRKPLPQPKDED